MSSSQQYLTSDDMAMIERVLAKAGFREAETGPMDLDAASFLTREFQKGVTNEAGLVLSLKRYVRMRGTWH